MNTTDPNKPGWTPLAIGCHWTRGEYTVSTTTGAGESGYAIYRDRVRVTVVQTWPEVERLTSRPPMIPMLLTKRQALTIILGWGYVLGNLPRPSQVGKDVQVLHIPPQYRDTGHTRAQLKYLSADRYELRWVE